MTIQKLLKTLFVFKGKDLLAVLKEERDGTLQVKSCFIELEELKELETFLQDNGYSIG